MSDDVDIYVLALARQMREDDVVHVGASQFEVWQAAEVARRLWAPGLRLVAAGTYHLGASAAGMRLRSRTYARDVIATRQATFNQSRVFDDLHRARVAFAGGMQVDALGNANVIGVFSGGRLVRGPGSGGLPTLTSHSERFFIAVPRHSRRVLVERVHKISVLGDPTARRACGLPADALQEVITPMASFRPGAQGLELIALSPGLTQDQVQTQTGFAVRRHAGFAMRAPASAEEREALAHVRAGAQT